VDGNATASTTGSGYGVRDGAGFGVSLTQRRIQHCWFRKRQQEQQQQRQRQQQEQKDKDKDKEEYYYYTTPTVYVPPSVVESRRRW
jgi:hypothetical protein